MNKNLKHIILLIILFFLIFIYFLEPDCLFMKIFNIPCTACGMTRAFKYIINGDFINAISMNLLSIPLFICVIACILLYILNIIFMKDYIYIFFNLFVKYYKLLISVMIINWIINIVKHLYYY